ncbi:MAG: VanZ family protein [Microgenomates group bacterium]|nr:VanZ family protein [Microgenomates group bacterium]
MKLNLKILSYWLPPIFWMVFIFFLSSQHKISVTHKFLFDFIIFKTLHLIEYAILYFLLFRSFFKTFYQNLSSKINFFYPFILSFLYAISDEFHQTFIATRQGLFRDVIIDTLGIFLMYIYIKKRFKIVKKFL